MLARSAKEIVIYKHKLEMEMSELISGKEALIALANGEKVEWTHFSVGKWRKVPQQTAKLQYFLDDDLGWKFRLKQRTITINEIEVPAPFEPKIGDYFYVICPTSFTGYTEGFAENQKHLECLSMLGAWRTEEEIKQVVAALRSIFNKG